MVEPDETERLPLAEVAERLGKSRRTLHRWIKRLGLKRHHVGRVSGYAETYLDAATIEQLAAAT